MIEYFMASAVLFAVLLFITLFRIFFGKTAADKMVVLDVVNVLVVIIMIVLSIAFKEVILVDIGIVYALLSFVATLFLARYIGGKDADD